MILWRNHHWELHDSFHDLPFTPEHRKPPGSKFVTTLFDKERYVLHYRKLKLHLPLGTKLKCIHCVFSFNESDSLKEYTDLTQVKNDFEKVLYKLMSLEKWWRTFTIMWILDSVQMESIWTSLQPNYAFELKQYTWQIWLLLFI